MKYNIILIGFMGSGKSSVGIRLAKALSYQFYDTDQILEQKAGDSISHIFSVHGEEYFRNMETNLLRELLPELSGTVLSTGGGLPLREENARLLKELGYVIYLKASKETTINRLQGDTSRPLLQGDNFEQRIDELIQFRTPIYERAADTIVVTDGKSFEEIISSIIEAYRIEAFQHEKGRTSIHR